MPARKLPTPQDAAAARRIVLDGLAGDADLSELVTELASLHPRDNTFPGEVFLRLAADALDWCDASRQQPLALEGIRERFLPEFAFRGRQNHKLQFAVLAAAALRGGADPDLLEEVAWWQTDDFWQYALFAAIAYIPCRRGPDQCACTRGMPAAGPAPGLPDAITTIPACHGRQSAVRDQRAKRNPLRGTRRLRLLSETPPPAGLVRLR